MMSDLIYMKIIGKKSMSQGLIRQIAPEEIEGFHSMMALLFDP
jgi:hypothetical protein